MNENFPVLDVIISSCSETFLMDLVWIQACFICQNVNNVRMH